MKYLLLLLLVGCAEPKFIVRDKTPFNKTGIVLYPYIFMDSTVSGREEYRHEMIHWMQIQRVGPGHFYIYYFLHWLFLTITHPFRDNYPYIIYEKQATEFTE